MKRLLAVFASVVILVPAGLRIDGEIIGVVADMDDAAAVAGRALPADAPAEQILQQARRPFRLADGDVHMFDEAGAHDFILSIRVMLETATTSS